MHQATRFGDVFLKAAKVVLLSHTVLTRWPGKCVAQMICRIRHFPDALA
jgi:hypothetical protein